MENKYAGIFIEAFHSVLGSFSSKQIVSADIQVPITQFIADDISITIGMSGDVDGRVYMSMNAETGQILASEMLGGLEITEIDELVISAVSELCNMIMGNACTSISEENTQIDITPPMVNTNGKTSFGNGNPSYNIAILLQDLGNVDFNVAMKSA